MMEQLIEDTLEDVRMLEGFDTLMEKDLKEALRTLFLIAGKEKRSDDRRRYLQILNKLIEISARKVELDNEEIRQIKESFRKEMDLVSGQKDKIGKIHKSFSHSVTKLKEISQDLSKRRYLASSTFFWDKGDASTNSGMAKHFTEVLREAQGLLGGMGQGIFRYIIRDKGSEGFINVCIALSGQIAQCQKEYFSLLQEIEKKQSPDLKNKRHVKKYQNINDVISKGIEKVIGLYPGFEEYFSHGLAERDKQIAELNEMLEKISSVNLATKSSRKIYASAIKRTSQRARAKVKLSLRRGQMNVLILTIPTSIKSGVCSSVMTLAHELDRSKLNIFQITHWWHRYFFFDSLGRYVQKQGKYYHGERGQGNLSRVTISPFSILDADGRAISLDYKWAGKHAMDYLVDQYSFKPDVIHVHTHTFQYDNAFDTIMKKAGNPPVVYTLHALIPYIRAPAEIKSKICAGSWTDHAEIVRFRESMYLSDKERSQEEMIRRADRIVCIADIHKLAFDTLYPEFKEKSRIIVNGTDIHQYMTKDTEKKAIEYRKKISPRGEFTIGYIGRVEKMKIRDLPTAFCAIRKYIPHCRLVLVGAISSKPKTESEFEERKRSLLKNMIVGYGLSQEIADSIEVLPWIDGKAEMAAVIRALDLVVMPMVSPELYSMAALESISLGVPVITCEGGLSFGKSDSEKAIIDSVMNFYKERSSDRTKQALLLAQDKVRERYSTTRFIEEHIKLYKELT